MSTIIFNENVFCAIQHLYSTYLLCNIWLHIWSILDVKKALSGMRLIPDGGGIESTMTNSNNSVNSNAMTNTLWIWILILCGMFELPTSSKYLLMLSIMVLRVWRAPYLDSPSCVTAADESERTLWLLSAKWIALNQNLLKYLISCLIW